MKRLHLDEDIKPVTEFRARTVTIIEQVRRTERALALTQRGRGAAEFERLVSELELLRDVHVAEDQLAKGEGISHDQARARVLASSEESGTS